MVENVPGAKGLKDKLAGIEPASAYLAPDPED